MTPRTDGDLETTTGPDRRWPVWARRLVSAALAWHLTALAVGVLGATPPRSMLEDLAYQKFLPYFQLIDQGYNYSYYSPEPPPTPVVEATLHFADGRPARIVRLPERGTSPRLRYQRQLALAHFLHNDFLGAREATGDGGKSPLAHSYARHLCATHPGCASVTLGVKMHLIPEIARVLKDLEERRGARVNLDDDEFFGEFDPIGDYPCER